jgi:hypothetical protein
MLVNVNVVCHRVRVNIGLSDDDLEKTSFSGNEATIVECIVLDMNNNHLGRPSVGVTRVAVHDIHIELYSVLRHYARIVQVVCGYMHMYVSQRNTMAVHEQVGHTGEIHII